MARPVFLALRGVVLACALGAVGAPLAASHAQVTVSKPASALPGARYAWVEMPKVLDAESDARLQDAALRGRVTAALDKALQGRGYRLAGKDEKPDLLVGYRIGVRDVRETTVSEEDPSGAVAQAGFHCGGGDCSQVVTADTDGQAVLRMDSKARTEGGLLVEVIEPGTIRVLWRALNRGTVQAGGGSQKKLDALAEATLAQLPRAPK